MGHGDGRRHTQLVDHHFHSLIPARLAPGKKNRKQDIEHGENHDANSEDSGPGLQFQQSAASGEVGETPDMIWAVNAGLASFGGAGKWMKNITATVPMAPSTSSVEKMS